MVTHMDIVGPTASGDTTKTSVGTFTVPKKAKRIAGVYSYSVAGATLTTGEAVTGQIELESSDINIKPFIFPTEVVSILTSGAIAFNPRIIPVDIPVDGGEEIEAFVTMDMAQTGGLKTVVGFIYEE